MVKSQYVGFAFDGRGGNKKLVNSLALPATRPPTLQQVNTLDAPQRYSHGEPNSTSTPLIAPYISNLIGPSLMRHPVNPPQKRDPPSAQILHFALPNVHFIPCCFRLINHLKTTNHHTLCESLKSDP